MTDRLTAEELERMEHGTFSCSHMYDHFRLLTEVRALTAERDEAHKGWAQYRMDTDAIERQRDAARQALNEVADDLETIIECGFLNAPNNAAGLAHMIAVNAARCRVAAQGDAKCTYRITFVIDDGLSNLDGS